MIYVSDYCINKMNIYIYIICIYIYICMIRRIFWNRINCDLPTSTQIHKPSEHHLQLMTNLNCHFSLLTRESFWLLFYRISRSRLMALYQSLRMESYGQFVEMSSAYRIRSNNMKWIKQVNATSSKLLLIGSIWN